ncbi:hypothetical protein [Micromonospora rubida]
MIITVRAARRLTGVEEPVPHQVAGAPGSWSAWLRRARFGNWVISLRKLGDQQRRVVGRRAHLAERGVDAAVPDLESQLRLKPAVAAALRAGLQPATAPFSPPPFWPPPLFPPC